MWYKHDKNIMCDVYKKFSYRSFFITKITIYWHLGNSITKYYQTDDNNTEILTSLHTSEPDFSSKWWAVPSIFSGGRLISNRNLIHSCGEIVRLCEHMYRSQQNLWWIELMGYFISQCWHEKPSTKPLLSPEKCCISTMKTAAGGQQYWDGSIKMQAWQ